MFPEMILISSRASILLAAFLLASTCMTDAEADTCTNCKVAGNFIMIVTIMILLAGRRLYFFFLLFLLWWRVRSNGNSEVYVRGVCCGTFYTNPLAMVLAWRNIGNDDIYVTGARCRVEGWTHLWLLHQGTTRGEVYQFLSHWKSYHTEGTTRGEVFQFLCQWKSYYIHPIVTLRHCCR